MGDRIEFRPGSLLRGQIPAPGCVDPFAGQLQELGARVNEIGDDDATSTVKPPAIEALDAGSRVRAFIWSLNDKWQAPASEMGSMQQRASEEARRGVPGFGHGSGAAYEAAREGAASDATKRFQAGITADLSAKYAPKGDALVTTWIEALKGLMAAIDE